MRLLRKLRATEGSIDKVVVEYAKFREPKLLSIKLTMLGRYGIAGLPDRVYLLPLARIFFMEMKAPGEACTDLQLAMHSRLRRLGFRVYVVDNVALGRGVIDTELRGARRAS